MSKIKIKIARDGRSTVSAFCLKTDFWGDWQFFIETAKKDYANDDSRVANRNLRAALLFLFAHLEASVNDLIYKSDISNSNLDNSSIQRKCNLLAARTKIESPAIHQIKEIRNILVHPGGKKDDSKVFEKLSVDFLQDFGLEISTWLDSVSNVLSLPRFSNTEEIVSNFKDRFGGTEEVEEI